MLWGREGQIGRLPFAASRLELDGVRHRRMLGVEAAFKGPRLGADVGILGSQQVAATGGKSIRTAASGCVQLSRAATTICSNHNSPVPGVFLNQDLRHRPDAPALG